MSSASATGLPTGLCGWRNLNSPELKAVGEDRPNPDRGEHRTRLGAVWTALGVAIVALLAILIFVLQNPDPVRVSFLIFQGRLPLAVALLFAMLLGAVIVLAAGTARILQLRALARRARKAHAASIKTASSDAEDAAPPRD